MKIFVFNLNQLHVLTCYVTCTLVNITIVCEDGRHKMNRSKKSCLWIAEKLIPELNCDETNSRLSRNLRFSGSRTAISNSIPCKAASLSSEQYSKELLHDNFTGRKCRCNITSTFYCPDDFTKCCHRRGPNCLTSKLAVTNEESTLL